MHKKFMKTDCKPKIPKKRGELERSHIQVTAEVLSLIRELSKETGTYSQRIEYLGRGMVGSTQTNTILEYVCKQGSRNGFNIPPYIFDNNGSLYCATRDLFILRDVLNCLLRNIKKPVSKKITKVKI